MKTIAKLSLTAALFIAFAGLAQAGDPGPRWQAELQRQRQAERSHPATTVAVYSKAGLGNCPMNAPVQRAETHFEFRTNAHGQTMGVYVPGSK